MLNKNFYTKSAILTLSIFLKGGSSHKLNLQTSQASATRGQQTTAPSNMMATSVPGNAVQQQYAQQPSNYTTSQSQMHINTQFHHQYVTSHQPFYHQQAPFISSQFSNQPPQMTTAANQQPMFTQAANQQQAYYSNPPITTVASGGDVIPNQVLPNNPQQAGYPGNGRFQAPQQQQQQVMFGSNASINTMVTGSNAAPAEGQQVNRNNNNLNKNS